MKIQKTVLWSLVLALVLVESATARLIPPTDFTYQGRVNNNGVPANGVYDFQFTIYDSTNGSGGLVAGPLTNATTSVSNGLFTVQLDFGSDVFDGSIRWLDIAVRTNGAGTFTVLTPRQQITPTPYAIAAQNALSANTVQAGGVLGTLSSPQLPANVLTNGATGVSLGVQTNTGNETVMGSQTIWNGQFVMVEQTVAGDQMITGSSTIVGNQTVLGIQTLNSNLVIGFADSQAPLQIGMNAPGAGWIIGNNSSVGGYTALVAGLSSPTNGYAYFQSVQASGGSLGNLILNPSGGNVGIANTNPANLLVVGGSVSPAYCNGTTWVNGSDRNAKQDFAAVNPDTVLEKISAMPITEWTYKVDTDGSRHIGPMAQDFHAAFGLNGLDDKHIATVDESGVALAAIQGLNQKVESGAEKAEARIRTLESENADLKARVEALEKILLRSH